MIESKNILRIIAVAAAVFTIASVTILLTRDHTEIAAVWITNALILATILRMGHRDCPPLMIACYLANAAANLATGNGWIIAVFCSAANVVEILICGWILTRNHTPDFGQGQVRDLLRLLIGAIFGALASSTIATLAISFRNDVAPMELFFSWFASDALGLIIFVPGFAILSSGSVLDALRGRRSARTAALYWGAFASGVALIFGQSSFDLLPAAPLLLIAIAFAFEAASVALALAVVGFVAVVATASGIGPESLREGGTTFRLHYLQAFLALLVFSSVPVAVALSQRRRLQENLVAAHAETLAAHDELMVSEGQLQAIATAAQDIIMRYLRDTTVTYASAASGHVLGYTPDELIGIPMERLIHPDDHERGRVELAAIVEAGPDAPPQRLRLRVKHKNGHWLWLEGCPRARYEPRTGKVTAIYDVLRDVTEQQTLSEALHQARERAEQAAHMKAEFLANMSHELRTPLNSVIGYSQLLSQAPDLGERSQRFAALIESASRLTLSIVSDVLDASAVERGRLVLRTVSTSVPELLHGVHAMMAPQAERKDLDLVLIIDPALAPRHDADADRLRQVLLNLLSNAVKFTDAGRVELAATVVGAADNAQHVRFAVRDTGCGIAAEHHAAIFERFAQLPGRQQSAGTGLGLSIAKSLVDLMGGVVGVRSAPGQGATFEVDVVLPLVAADECAAEPTQAAGAIGGRVLVVDDVDLNRELVQCILEPAGYTVSVASSGEEAVAACDQVAFDLVFMDVRMPGLDGLAATRIIRSGQGRSAQAPIVALTAVALPEQISACLQAGMDGHLAKPVQQDEILAAVARWVGAGATAVAERDVRSDLRVRFRERLLEDRRALQEWRDADAPPEAMRALVHRLAGSAGSFGYEEIGALAADLNEALESGRGDRQGLTATLLDMLNATLGPEPARSAA